MFQPPLPPAKARAVSSLGFGCVDKLFISFPAAAAPLPAPRSAQALSAASPAASDHKELIRSYQLLWPQQDPAALGPVSSQSARPEASPAPLETRPHPGHSPPQNVADGAQSGHPGNPAASEARSRGATSEGTATPGSRSPDGCSGMRQPLRELSHQQARHAPSQAPGQASKQGRAHGASAQPGSQGPAQAAAPSDESVQGAAEGDPWYTSLHSMRFGGSEFVNSARWFMAGQAGADAAAGGRGGEGTGQPGSGLHSDGRSSEAQSDGRAEAHRVGAERSAPTIPGRLRWHAALLPADLACMLQGASCKGCAGWGRCMSQPVMQIAHPHEEGKAGNLNKTYAMTPAAVRHKCRT